MKRSRRRWLIATAVVLAIATAFWVAVQLLWTHPELNNARVRIAGWLMIALAFPWSIAAMEAYGSLPRPLGSALFHFAVVVGFSFNCLAGLLVVSKLWSQLRSTAVAPLHGEGTSRSV